ncbi:S-adenosylmethionine:tRNA ribosyltransferase-isomerase, partial [Kitasatospora sp. NPDC058263]
MTAAADPGIDVTVPPELSARAPEEARGTARDGVRMLVGRRSGPAVGHRRFTELPEVLRPGDLLVVNNSATLPAALPGRLADGTPVALHLSSARPDRRGAFLVELRRPAPGAGAAFWPPEESPARPGLRVALPGGAAADLVEAFTPRLWYARLALPEPLVAYLGRHGKAI